MLLGHWYLVSPRIPRRPLQRLAAAGAVGVVLDAAVVLSFGYPHAGSVTALVVSVGLAGTSFPSDGGGLVRAQVPRRIPE